MSMCGDLQGAVQLQVVAGTTAGHLALPVHATSCFTYGRIWPTLHMCTPWTGISVQTVTHLKLELKLGVGSGGDTTPNSAATATACTGTSTRARPRA